MIYNCVKMLYNCVKMLYILVKMLYNSVEVFPSKLKTKRNGHLKQPPVSFNQIFKYNEKREFCVATFHNLFTFFFFFANKCVHKRGGNNSFSEFTTT